MGKHECFGHRLLCPGSALNEPNQIIRCHTKILKHKNTGKENK